MNEGRRSALHRGGYFCSRYAYVHNNPLSYSDPSGFGQVGADAVPCPDNPSKQCGGEKNDGGGGSMEHIEVPGQRPYDIPAEPLALWDFVFNSEPSPSDTHGSDAPPGSGSPGGVIEEITVTATKCIGSPYAAFFENNFEGASSVGSQYNVDSSLLLGLAAAESGYGTSPMATTQNNPFGATPGGFSTPGVTYNSYASAWQNWGNQWGPRVNNVDDNVNQFINNLARDNQFTVGAIDMRGPYNTQDRATGGDQNWAKNVAGTIRGVQKRLPPWKKSGC